MKKGSCQGTPLRTQNKVVFSGRPADPQAPVKLHLSALHCPDGNLILNAEQRGSADEGLLQAESIVDIFGRKLLVEDSL